VTAEEDAAPIDPGALRQVVERAAGAKLVVESVIVQHENRLVLVSVRVPSTLSEADRLNVEVQVQEALRAIEAAQDTGYVYVPVFPPAP
jgi:hypothetical protein